MLTYLFTCFQKKVVVDEWQDRHAVLTKSSLYRVHHLVKKLRLDLQPNLKVVIEKSPFGFLLQSPDIQTDQKVLTALVSRWKNGLLNCPSRAKRLDSSCGYSSSS